MEIGNNTSFLPEGYVRVKKKGGRPKKKDFSVFPKGMVNEELKECVTCGDPTFSCNCDCKGLKFIPF